MRPPAAVPPCCSERLGSSLLFKERDRQPGRASDLLSGSLVLSSAIPSIGVEVGRPLRWFLAARRHLPRPRSRRGTRPPYADADMMQIPPDEISGNVADAHAVLILDRAGWRTTASSTRPTTSPRSSRAPELNPVGNVRRSLRQNWLSNTAFENDDAIIDAACAAWRNLFAQPETIASIGMRDWAHIGQTP